MNNQIQICGNGKRALALIIVSLAGMAGSALGQALSPPTNLQVVSAVSMPTQGGTPGQAGATGWQHTGVALATCAATSYSGTNLVLDGCDFNGQVRITGGNVTIKRSRVRASCGTDTSCAAILISGGGPHLIEDVEIDSTNPNANGCVDSNNCRQDRTIGITRPSSTTSPITIRRVWTHNTTRGMDITGQQNITVVDSYLGPNISPPIGQPPGSCANNSERQHASAIRAAGGTRQIAINNTVLHIGYCAWASGLIATYPEGGPNSGWEISGGRWIIEGQNDGAYGIAMGYTPPAEQQNTNYAIRDLQISTQYYGTGCPSGCAQSWDELGGSKSWSNVRKYNPGKSDDGQPISP
jgi:hypothetical protein